MTTPLAPTAHHPLGPSTWPARSECAKFEPQPDVDIDDVDGEDEEDTSARGRGTVMHHAVAMLLTGDLPTRQKALDGLSEREVDQVQWVVTKAIELIEANGYAQSDLRVEQRVTMMKPGEDFEVLYFGTGDGECGPIDFDWKFAEPRNYFAQLVGYALPKMEARGERRRYGYIINGRYKRVERYVLDIETVRTVAYGLLSRVMSPHSRPTPCSYCGFCARRATCEAIVPTAVSLVDRREDWALKLPTPHVSQINDPAWVGAARYVWKRFLENWGSAIEFASTSMADRGVTPLGFKRRDEKGRTTISDARKAFAVLTELVGEDVLWSAYSTSLTNLAKKHAAAAGIPEAKSKAIITNKLAASGLLKVGEPTFKLIADPDAEAIIRAGLTQKPISALPQ